MAKMGLAQKLTPKVLGWDRNRLGTATKAVPADTGRILLGRVAGIINDLRQTVDNETGEIQNGLKGQFRGISSLNRMEQVMKTVDGKEVPERDEKDNLIFRDTGEKITVTAGVCYLPSGIQGMLEGALASAKEKDARATVNFAIDLYARPDTNKAGYTFDADNLVPATAADPLGDLLAAAEEHAQELPASEGQQQLEDQSGGEGANAGGASGEGKEETPAKGKK